MFKAGSGSQLIGAIKRNDYKVVKGLLELGADPNICIDHSSPLGYALNYTSDIYIVDMVKILLEYGADPNIDCKKKPALSWLFFREYNVLYSNIHSEHWRTNFQKITKLLLKYGADPYYAIKTSIIIRGSVVKNTILDYMNTRRLSLVYDSLVRQQAAYPRLMTLNPSDRNALLTSSVSRTGLLNLLPELSNGLDYNLRSPGFEPRILDNIWSYLV